MSDAHAPHDTTAPDETPINTGKVIAVGVASLLTFVLGSWWALEIERATERRVNPNGPAPIPAALQREEIGIVDFVPFDLNRWVPKDRAAANQKLNTTAWVDKAAGIVRLDIDRAIELVVAEQAKAVPTPAPVAAPPEPKPKPDPKKPAPKRTEKK